MMSYDPKVWQPEELKKDLLSKAHITDRVESVINQIADAKSLTWTVDCVSDIIDSEGPKLIFTEKARSPVHVLESMSIRLKPIWDEITEKNLWNKDDKVLDIYTERIITEVEAWLDSLAEKTKVQPSVKVDVSDDTPVKKTMTKAEFYSFLHNKDVQSTLIHIGDTRHLMGYLTQEKRIDGEVAFEYSCTNSMKGPYHISMTDYYDRNYEKFGSNPAEVLADLKAYIERQLDSMMFLDKDLHTKNDTSEARELNQNLFALLIMTKGYNRLTKLADRRGMKVKYDGQGRSVTFYKPGLKTIALAITINMDDFVNLMSKELLSADDKDKVAWFAEYCDSTIERYMHSLSYIHDSIRKWCKNHNVNVTFVDEKEDPLKIGYMIFWIYPKDRVRQEALVIDIANNPEFAGLCHEESEWSDNGLAPWNPRYAKVRTSYALIIDDAHSIIKKVIGMIVANLLTPRKKVSEDPVKENLPLAKGLQEAFKNFSSKELYKSYNSVPKEWIDQFVEENGYFQDFMRASICTIVEFLKFIHAKEQEAKGDNGHGE